MLAVSSLNSDPAVSTAAELMYRDRMPSGSQIRLGPMFTLVGAVWLAVWLAVLLLLSGCLIP